MFYFMSLTHVFVLHTNITYLSILHIGSPSRNLPQFKNPFSDTPPTFLTFQIQTNLALFKYKRQPPLFQILRGQAVHHKNTKAITATSTSPSHCLPSLLLRPPPIAAILCFVIAHVVRCPLTFLRVKFRRTHRGFSRRLTLA